MTGTKKERPELNLLLEFARTGDAIVIFELTRMSRSTLDLNSISEALKEKGIELISLKEKADTTSATGKAMFGMLAVMGSIRERSYFRTYQRGTFCGTIKRSNLWKTYERQ